LPLINEHINIDLARNFNENKENAFIDGPHDNSILLSSCLMKQILGDAI
jgi:hypothetical protein